MIHLEEVIRQFGQEALRLQLEESEKDDTAALLALENKTKQGRSEAIRKWLQGYQVFQGIPGPKRIAIAASVVEWADTRDKQRDLTTVDALVAAHTELEDVCIRAYGKKRSFNSLASKALWLCYPSSVPILDDFTQSALSVISKLEADTTSLPETDSDYRKFVHLWKTLYDRYAAALNEIDIGTYPYRVRIFDKILWLLGEPRYGRRTAIPQ